MNATRRAIARVLRHLRCCFGALADGAFGGRRHRLAAITAQLSVNPRAWRFPIISDALLADLASLGIGLPSRFRSRDNIHTLQALLVHLDEPLTSLITSSTADESDVEVHFSDADLSSHPQLSYAFHPWLEAPTPGVSIYAHGSMTDGTATAMSDVDDLVVFHRDAWSDIQTLSHAAYLLARSCRRFQDIDPFQHHGHWVATEFDLRAYDQSFLPLAVLEGARRISGARSITIRAFSDSERARDNARSTAASILNCLRLVQRQNGLRAFALKGLIGEIAIMPAYIWQSRGRMLAKPEAIANADQLYSPQAMAAVQWATRVRREGGSWSASCRRHVAWRLGAVLARRQSIEAVVRWCSPWISNRHPLGLNDATAKAIARFAEESFALASAA